MDAPTFFDRLLTKRGLNPNSLATAIGKPSAQSGFDRLRKGLIRQPRRGPALDAAAKYLHVDVLAFYDSALADAEWARLGGEPASLKVSPRRLIDLSDNPDYLLVRRVQFKLSAGVHGFVVEYPEDEDPPIMFRKEWLDSKGYRPERLFAAKVANSSMEPGLHDGDLVVVNTAQTTPKDGAVFAVNYEGELVIKRLIRDAGQWWLYSDNPNQAEYPRRLCHEGVFMVGEVVHKQSTHI